MCHHLLSLLEAHRDAGHRFCRHLCAQCFRRRPRRLVDDVQCNRPDDRVPRLLLRLLARQWRCCHPPRCCPFRRRPPLRRPRDAERCLLGGGEGAQVHLLAAAPHPRLIGFGLAGKLSSAMAMDAEEARVALCHAQRQPLSLHLLQRLLARKGCRRYSLLRCRCLPRRRPRDVQCRLLGRDEVAQVHLFAVAPKLRLERPGIARMAEVHAEEARLALGQAQR
eukprot:scaffold111772_cov54-Phaeocystis_antarctica.AAC.2